MTGHITHDGAFGRDKVKKSGREFKVVAGSRFFYERNNPIAAAYRAAYC